MFFVYAKLFLQVCSYKYVPTSMPINETNMRCIEELRLFANRIIVEQDVLNFKQASSSASIMCRFMSRLCKQRYQPKSGPCSSMLD